MPLPQKGFSQFILLIIMTAGIAIGLFLVRNPQVFSPKAQTVNSPVSFTLKQPTVSCINGRQTVKLEWTHITDGVRSPDQTIAHYFGDGFNYEVLYREDESPEIYLGSAKFNNIYLVSTLNGLQPGHSYGFLVAAKSPSYGPIYANQAWSDRTYGWLAIPASCDTSSSPSPSPSLTSSPSPSAPSNSPADIDGNGTVDIQDINAFVQDFIDQNLRSDLDNDGDVDIFDFNIFVTGFQNS